MTWAKVALRDLGDWYGGGTPSKSNPKYWNNGDIPWLSPKDMGATVLAGTRDRVTRDAVAGSSARLVPKDSVAVVTRSGILARTLPVALVPFETTLNQDMRAVVARPGIDPRWIAWGLRAFERDLLRETRKAGTTVASIEMPRFNAFELPVPSISEQRQIVDVLEDHLSRLDAAGRLLERSKLYTEGVLASAARDWLWNAETTVAFNGIFTPAKTPAVTIAQSEYLSQGVLRVVDQGEERSPHFTDDVSASFTGRLPVLVFGDHTRRAKFLDHPFAVGAQGVKLLHPVGDPRFAYWCLRTAPIDSRGYGRHYARLRATRFPHHSAEMQIAISRRLDHVSTVCVRLEESIYLMRRRTGSLRRAVLAAAFEGKLTGRRTDQEVIEELAGV